MFKFISKNLFTSSFLLGLIFVSSLIFFMQPQSVSAAWTVIGSGLGSGNGNLHFPEAVYVDSSGNIYAADASNQRIEKFDSSGNYVSQFSLVVAGESNTPYPTGIDVDSSGNIYVTDYDNSDYKIYNSSGVYQSKVMLHGAEVNKAPVGIALDSSNNVYVVDVNNNRVQKFNSSGVYQSQFGVGGGSNGQFSSPQGIDIDSTGNIFVTDGGNGRVQKFNYSGVYQSQFGTGGSGDGQISSNADGLHIDPSDNIWIADSGNDRIQEFTSAGVFAKKYGTSGSGDGQLSIPDGLWITNTGNGSTIYVADTNNSRIFKFPDTNIITASAGSHGSISPSGAVSVTGSQSFTITPITGYHVADVLVDSVSIGAVTSHTFTNVTAAHTISASFAIDTFSLVYTAGANGSITGTSPQTVNYGANGSAVTAVPANGYHFVNWSDNSIDNPRTDLNVTANVSVTANFAVTVSGATVGINYYIINTSAGDNGSFSPSSVDAAYGTSQTFTIIPNTGYQITDVLVDGKSVGAVTIYTFSNIIVGHTISANFSLIFPTNIPLTSSEQSNSDIINFVDSILSKINTFLSTDLGQNVSSKKIIIQILQKLGNLLNTASK